MAEGTVWINTTDYTPLELVLFAVGSFGWVIVYAIVVRDILRYKFIEIPWVAVAGNVAWEFLWSFVLDTDMGRLFSLGYQAWFFLDVFIVIGLYRYGQNQLSNPKAIPLFRSSVTFAILAWTVVLYYFAENGYDTVTGATSGFLLNVMMSALYIMYFLARGDVEPFSVLAAWSKFIGSGLISVFCFLNAPENTFLLSLCVMTAILDVAYIVLMNRAPKRCAP